jgi:glutaredoxin
MERADDKPEGMEDDSMNKLTVFYLEGCPYCRNARKAFEALTAENKAYGDVKVDWVEESQNAAMADTYDYYRVPSVFMDKEKLYEAAPSDTYEVIKARFKAALDAALA